MNYSHITTIDFETEAIQSRPAYPPVPIGVSIKNFGAPATYLAWGHKTGNNITLPAAKRALKQAVEEKEILCHHAKFDCDVMETHMGIKMPPWQRIHDTTFLLFLEDPNMRNLGLKPSAEEILGWPSDEKDMLGEWLCAHQPVPGVRISRGPKSDHYFMRYLSWAPGDLTGVYANGDVERTEALFAKLHPRIIARGMSDAYDRERRLMPVLLAMERRGVRVDLNRLRTDVALYQGVQEKIDAWLRKKLRLSLFFNIDSDAFVDALLKAGVADASLMGVTESGKIATNKQALAAGVTDKQLAAVLQYRAQLHTSVDTSLTTWLGMAEASGGFIYSNWNQVKGEGRGARTGRLSSSPNFQNIPKSWKPLFSHEKKGLPQAPFRNLPPLPLCRSYIIPYRDDHVLIGRDFSQHELRILAHFGDGELLARYRADQWIDMHDTVKDDLLRLAGREITRDTAKTLNFSLLYGMGIGEMARRLILTVDDAKMLKKAVLDLYPELEDLYKTTRALARSDEPIVTWGGREAFCEVPTKDKTGKFIDWSYKLPNYLIQGSASDAAKEAIIRYADAAPKEHFLLLTVHDEILASVPRCDIVCGHDTMRSCMESLEFDVPNLTEGKFSATNWAALTPYDKRGVTLV